MIHPPGGAKTSFLDFFQIALWRHHVVWPSKNHCTITSNRGLLDDIWLMNVTSSMTSKPNCNLFCFFMSFSRFPPTDHQQCRLSSIFYSKIILLDNQCLSFPEYMQDSSSSGGRKLHLTEFKSLLICNIVVQLKKLIKKLKLK